MSVPRLPSDGRSKVVAAFLAGLLVGAVSITEFIPAARLTTVAGDETPGGPVGEDPGTGGTPTGGPAAPQPSASAGSGGNKGPGSNPGNPGTNPVAPGRPGLECRAGRNGGATDRGVSDKNVKMATTVVQSGIGSAFLGEIKYAMEARVVQINRAGGICGRQLTIEYKDDGWDPQKGSQYLSNFVQSGVFAVPVGASSEGLGVFINREEADKGQTPIVGTDGLEINQYIRHKDRRAQPWVWPVATATASSARIMVNEAYRRGARSFGIVFDRDYKFGVEAASAFNTEVKRLTGNDVVGFNRDDSCQKQFCGIRAGQNSYSSEVVEFYRDKADFVALFLEPQTAQTWMRDNNTPGANTGEIKYGYGAAQPLFTEQFEANCRDKCDTMQVWTGFKPAIKGAYDSDPAVREYVTALRAVRPDADIYNQFSQGAYVGMKLLEQALREVGPDLKRSRLKAVLDRTTLASGLTIQAKLTFTPTTRYANVTMQGFEMLYKGTRGGWRAGPIVRDERPEAGAG